MDYYKLLNVNQNSTKEDIESSYQEQLSKLNQAYNVLSDTQSKKQYDEKRYRLSLLDGFSSPFENGTETFQEYDEPVKPKYIDSWGLIRAD